MSRPTYGLPTRMSWRIIPGVCSSAAIRRPDGSAAVGQPVTRIWPRLAGIADGPAGSTVLTPGPPELAASA
eukprot:scaffold293334_cov27-Tisochrysis_lutea.AAC.2